MNSSQGKKPSSKLTLIYVAVIALVITGVAVYIAVQYDAIEVLSTIKNIDPIFVLLGISMIFLQLYSEAGCLKILFSLLGRKISFFLSEIFVFSVFLPKSSANPPFSHVNIARFSGFPLFSRSFPSLWKTSSETGRLSKPADTEPGNTSHFLFCKNGFPLYRREGNILWIPLRKTTKKCGKQKYARFFMKSAGSTKFYTHLQPRRKKVSQNTPQNFPK